jgi:cobalt-zinc-cadmium efflux system outer membrane protein
MSTRARARQVSAALTLLVCSIPASAGTLTIDLPTAIARAKERAPAAIVAAARIAEARAAGAGARVWFADNPEIEVGAGRRFGDPETTPIEARLEQPLELGRRGARIRVADAGVRFAGAASDAALRALSFDVTIAFLDARHADRVVELGERVAGVVSRAADAAERRRKAGDITDLDVDLARVASGRARSAVAAARADRAEAVGRLAALIGAAPDDTIVLAGDLAPPPLSLDALRAAVPARADLRALDSEAGVARAEASQARVNGWPDVALWIGYERDENDTIAIGGVRIRLPVWNRARGDRAAARAKLGRVEAEREAVAAVASRQVIDAFEAYTRAREAVDVFERDVLPSLADAETLVERSIDAGQIAVADFLVARQELFEARRDELDRQLALAKAAATARFVAGVSP